MTGKKYKPAPPPTPKTPDEPGDPQSRLEAAEFAVASLAENADGEIDTRVKSVIDAAVVEVERILAEGKQRAEALVEDAERLRAIASTQADEAEARAREAVAGEARELLENVQRLQSQAEEKAAKIATEAEEKAGRIVAEAEARAAQTDKEIDARLAEAEAVYEKVERHIAAREDILAEVRKRADAIIRTAKTTAENVKEEAREAARKTTQNAAIEAERLIQVAKEEARQHMDRVTTQERDARERLEAARTRSQTG